MENLDKYIGLKHKYQGVGDYCDCLNLCQRFYLDHNYKQDWNDGKIRPPTFKEYKETQKYRIIRYLIKNFKLTRDPDDLTYGDITLFVVGGDIHLGVYIEDKKILCMQIPVIEGKSESTIYRSKYWLPFFKAGFKR